MINLYVPAALISLLLSISLSIVTGRPPSNILYRSCLQLHARDIKRPSQLTSDYSALSALIGDLKTIGMEQCNCLILPISFQCFNKTDQSGVFFGEFTCSLICMIHAVSTTVSEARQMGNVHRTGGWFKIYLLCNSVQSWTMTTKKWSTTNASILHG